MNPSAASGYLLKLPNETEALIDQVIACADSHKSSFGFLPHQSYHEAAARGRLWIYINHQSTILGYLFFGGRDQNITITQLYVNPKFRSTGIGTFLLNKLKQHAKNSGHQTISARVAADLPANAFWEKADFLIIRQLKGGQAKDRVINSRAYDVPSNSLWNTNSSQPHSELFLATGPQLLSPNYVLDLNVFFDVTKDRLDAEAARQLMGSALSNRLRICVTPEFCNELQRHTHSKNEDPILNLAKSLPTLPFISPEILHDKIQELGKIIFPETNRSKSRRANDASDLIHLASCIHHNTSGFVTREKAILRCAELLKNKYRLDVVSPADIHLNFDHHPKEDFPLSSWISGKDFQLSELKESQRQNIEEFLTINIGLDKNEMQWILDAGTDKSPRRRITANTDTGLIGFASWSLNTIGRHTIACNIFVEKQNAIAQHFVDHALQRICDDLHHGSPTAINLITLQDQQIVVDTALERNFVAILNATSERFCEFKRTAYKGVVLPENWLNFRQKLLSHSETELPERFPTFPEACHTGLAFSLKGKTSPKPKKLLAFETFFAPLLLITPGRPSVIVPIRESYAENLLKITKAQISLLPSKEAQLRIERAYFGKSGLGKMLNPLGIAVFYVSGNGGGPKEAVGLARITYSGKISGVSAQSEYSRLGVLEDRTLNEISDKNGKVGIFTFDSFVKFDRPISFNTLKKLDCISGANLITTQRIKFDQLTRIVKAGFST
ncbi:MAG: GNAT family N-acetyltransferase [Pseudomonadota bacterium]|nr:GNAT family N-acetyltransferase [Pseudomonadota bacterium]